MKRAIAVFCIILVCVMLVACAAEPKSDEEKLVGTWVYEEDKSKCIVFDDDRTAVAKQDGKSISQKEYYYLSGGKLYMGNYGYKYEISGNKLTLYTSAGTLVLKKM